MSHCNRQAEPGQGSSTRCKRAAAWHRAEHFLAGYNRVRIDAANVHAFSQAVVLTRGPLYLYLLGEKIPNHLAADFRMAIGYLRLLAV